MGGEVGWDSGMLRGDGGGGGDREGGVPGVDGLPDGGGGETSRNERGGANVGRVNGDGGVGHSRDGMGAGELEMSLLMGRNLLWVTESLAATNK